jgi:hypothetical protein
MTGIFKLVALRCLVLTAAFSLLLVSRALDGWARYGILRWLLVFGGLLAMEVCAWNLHFDSVSTEIKPPYPVVFAALATLLPALVIGGGFFSSPFLVRPECRRRDHGRDYGRGGRNDVSGCQTPSAAGISREHEDRLLFDAD